MFEDARLGVRHSIPINTNFKVLKYFSLSAGGTFNEVWNFDKIKKSYNETLGEVVTEVENGFSPTRTYNFSSGIGTTLYGMYNFDKKNKEKKIQAIRHVVRPNVSYNITPAFDQYYESYKKNIIAADGTTVEEIIEYSPYQNSFYGQPSNVYSSSIGFGIGNSIEAKVRDKITDSTEVTYRKVGILNNLNLASSYNIAGDSLKLNPISVSGGTLIAKKKLNINFNFSLDPYSLDNNNRRVEKLNINNNGSLFRLTNANLTLNYSFSSKDFDKNNKNNNTNNVANQYDTTLDNTEGLAGDRSDLSRSSFDDNEDEEPTGIKLYNYKIPWDLRIAYSTTYSNQQRQNEVTGNTLMFSGDVEFSPRWRVGISSGYDFKGKAISFTRLRFERDLLSWKFNFNWMPFGEQKSWFFFIGIKSSVLSDIKWDKNRERDNLIN